MNDDRAFRIAQMHDEQSCEMHEELQDATFSPSGTYVSEPFTVSADPNVNEPVPVTTPADLKYFPIEAVCEHMRFFDEYRRLGDKYEHRVTCAECCRVFLDWTPTDGTKFA